MGELQRVHATRPMLAPVRATEPQVVRGPSLVRRPIQTKLAVGAADDAFEREAERTADAVMAPNGALQFGGGSIRPSGIAASLMRFAQRALGKAEMPTKKDDDDKKKVAQKESAAAGPSIAPQSVEHSIDRMSAGGGTPLAPSLRSTFEPRFGYDFSDVRTHTSGDASHAATALGARAFTVGDHIFFGAGEYQPTSTQGQRLIAHELTHTIQQKPSASRASRMLAISSSAPVSAAPKRVQRLFDDTKKAVRDKVKGYIARDFPPWDLITLIIGWDPIAEKPVKGATRDWIHAAMKLAPDGASLFDKLDKEGKIDSVAKWWDTQVAKLDLSMTKIIALANQAWDAVGIADVTDPAAAWNKKIKPIFEPTVTRVWAFVKEVGGKILAVVKDLVLSQVGAWAQKQKGYPLLTMILGKDPVTGEEVKPTLKGVIFAVLDLIDGGDKVKENLEKSKTVEKAAAWFKAEVRKLDLTWEGIKALFTKAWDAFKVTDLLNPKLLFEKMAAIFGPSVMRLLSFLVAVGKKVLEFIFEGAMLIAGPIGLQIVGIVKKVGDTFNKIVNDPVAFIGHLVDAVKKGIGQFAKNIWEHLKTGLIGWLTGTLEGAGLVLPKVWDLKGILDLVLQILGITYAKIRVKLVKVLGEKTVGMLEKVFAFIKTLVTEGPAAAWQQIVEAIGGLWDLVIGGIKDWAVTKIVTAAITKLATMLNPAGAIIQAIIATYNTIAFFMERIKQILDFVEAIVDSIANIANGKIAAAANWVEKAMARSIPVLLGFLARLIGLGDVSEAVKKVITAIQVKVDKGIDFVIDWVVKKAKSLFGGKEEDKQDKETAPFPDAKAQKGLTMSGESHTVSVRVQAGEVSVTMASGQDSVLRELATSAMQEIDASPRSPEEKAFYRKYLGDIAKKANSAEIKSTYENAGRPPGADAWLLTYVTNIIEQDLMPLSSHGIKALSDFFKKIPPIRFLPASYRGQWIRWNLYVSTGEWDNVTSTVGPPQRAAIAKKVTDANAAKSAAQWDVLRIAPDGKPGYKIPSHAVLGSYTAKEVYAEDMSVDHIVPVAKHWTDMGGYNMDDSDRRKIGSGLGNAELVTREYNSRKQSLGAKYRLSVDANFESATAASKKMSAKIKDQAFLRSDAGEPLI